MFGDEGAPLCQEFPVLQVTTDNALMAQNGIKLALCALLFLASAVNGRLLPSPIFPTSDDIDGSNVRACTWLNYIARTMGNGTTISEAQHLAVDTMTSLDTQDSHRLGLGSSLAATVVEISKDCAWNASLPEAPFHPWLREREARFPHVKTLSRI